MADVTIGESARRCNPSLDRLAFLVGEWTTIGSHPELPGQALPGRTSFDWAEGGAFLIMRSQTDHIDFPDGIAIFASDQALGSFTMCWFDERGVSRLCGVEVGARLLHWHHDNPAFMQRVSIGANADGRTMLSRGEMSTDGGPWSDDLSQEFTRS